MEKTAGHAFISYVREDSHEVDMLQRTLEAAGVSVWRDTADLWPGEDWRVKIRRAITGNALVFIACFSTRSVARVKSYQNEELRLATEELRLRRPDDPWLIPVRFDDCEVPDFDLGGGRTLASIQRADFFGDSRDVGVARLVAAVLRLLAHSSPDQDIGKERVHVVTPPKPLVVAGQNSERVELDLLRGKYRMSWNAKGGRTTFHVYHRSGEISLVAERLAPGVLPPGVFPPPNEVFSRSGEKIVDIYESGRHSFTVGGTNITWKLEFKRLVGEEPGRRR